MKPRPIPQKLPGEMSKEELDDAVKKTVEAFFSGTGKRKQQEQKHFHLPPAKLRQMVEAEQKKRRQARKPSPPSDFDRTLSKIIKKAAKAGKTVAQLGEQELQSVPPLVIANEYGSNIDMLDMMEIPTDKEVDMTELANFYAMRGIDLGDFLFESAPVADEWQKYEHGRSLWNPKTINELGTQLFKLNTLYLDACHRKEFYISVRIKDDHWFRGDDVMYIEFAELHQLVHRNSLDKTLISCYCL